MGREDGNAQLFMNHKSKDSHLSSTSVVEFDCSLLELSSFIISVPAESLNKVRMEESETQGEKKTPPPKLEERTIKASELTSRRPFLKSPGNSAVPVTSRM